MPRPIAPAPVPTVTPGGAPTVGVPLTADTTGWAAGTSFTYQWLIDGTPVPGATSATYTPTADAVGFTVTVKVTGTLAGFNPVTQTSAADGERGPGHPDGRDPPDHLGHAEDRRSAGPRPRHLGAGHGLHLPVARQRDDHHRATGPRYTPAVATQVGQTLDVIVTGTKYGYTTTTKTSAATAPVAAGDPLALTPTPVLTGTPKVGVSYVASPGAWDDGVALTYQWAANGVTVAAGATAVAFTPTTTQLGSDPDDHGHGHQTGHPCGLQDQRGERTGRPGHADPSAHPDDHRHAESQHRRAPASRAPGTPAPRRPASGTPTASRSCGATATTYTPTVAQIGQVLTFEVTSTRAGYTTVVKTSPGKPILALAQTLTPTPLITGTAKVANTLTGDPGTWDVDTALSYQWFADGTAIDGATGLTYDVTPAELGKAITFAVTSTKASYETVTRTSGPTAAVSAGDLDPDPGADHHRHPEGGREPDRRPRHLGRRCDARPTSGPSTGPTSAGRPPRRTPPVPGDLGKVVTVKVTGAKDGYPNVTKESDPDRRRRIRRPLLNADPDDHRDAEGGPAADRGPRHLGQRRTLAYQWTADGTDIPGATAVTYTVGVGDLGKAVAVKVTGSKTGYNSVTKELTVELEHRGRRPGPDPGPDDHRNAAGEPAARPRSRGRGTTA